MKTQSFVPPNEAIEALCTCELEERERRLVLEELVLWQRIPRRLCASMARQTNEEHLQRFPAPRLNQPDGMLMSYFVPRRAPLRILTRNLAEGVPDSQVGVCVRVLGTAEPAAVVRVREEENGANVVEIEYNNAQPHATH